MCASRYDHTVRFTIWSRCAHHDTLRYENEDQYDTIRYDTIGFTRYDTIHLRTMHDVRTLFSTADTVTPLYLGHVNHQHTSLPLLAACPGMRGWDLLVCEVILLYHLLSYLTSGTTVPLTQY